MRDSGKKGTTCVLEEAFSDRIFLGLHILDEKMENPLVQCSLHSAGI